MQQFTICTHKAQRQKTMDMMVLHLQDPKIQGYVASVSPIALGFPGFTTRIIFRQTVWLTLEVLTVIVIGRGVYWEIEVPDRCRTEFIADFVVSCLHFLFVCQFS